ncbi:hypothetical protein DV736_g4967, partial [Chaetothyriales sp. CBS 134916]
MSRRERDSRSRSPHRHSDHRPHKWSRYDHNNDNRLLPFSASPLSKHDLDKYRPLFALYLDIQKQIDIEDLEAGEVKGRWKSFVGRWNHGDLAEGWYDPKTLERAVAVRQQEYEGEEAADVDARRAGRDISHEEEDDDEFGPALPTSTAAITDHHAHADRWARALGATEPSVDELKARREEAADDARSAQERQRDALRVERRVEKKLLKERLEDLVPRAEPGSRNRQLEKKRDANMSNRAFAQSAHEAGDVDLKDSDVMGEDTMSELKWMKQHEERKKNERELRREEMLRARRAEREERGRLLREKEEKTMDYLRGLARERFG